MHDLQVRETTRISVASNGAQADGQSGGASISADGRYVTFWSEATNLVAGDTNNDWDVFVHDRQTGETTRVSVASDGTQANGASTFPMLSADGRYVTFTSDATNLAGGSGGIFVHDRETGETTLVSVSSDGTPENRGSARSAISADGRFVTFLSSATNLVEGDTNNRYDIFVHDLQTRQTERVSVSSEGMQGDDDSYDPNISADGRIVSFTSRATTLAPNDTNFHCPIEGDPNTNCLDVFVHDRETGETTLASVTPAGVAGDFVSGANNIPPSLSADGRYVVFWSWASDLVPNDTNGAPDAFVHDRLTGVNEIVSLSTEGTQVRSDFFQPAIAISGDGRVVAFNSDSSDLVPGDTGNEDVFARIREVPSAVELTGPTLLSQRRPLATLLILTGVTLLTLALRGTRRTKSP